MALEFAEFARVSALRPGRAFERAADRRGKSAPIAYLGLPAQPPENASGRFPPYGTPPLAAARRDKLPSGRFRPHLPASASLTARLPPPVAPVCDGSQPLSF